MAEINPTRINQRPVDSNTEVSPDGVPLSQTAAPTSAPRVPTQPSKGAIESIADLPKEDESTTTEQTPPEKLLNFNDFKEAAAVDTTPLVDKTVKPDEKTDKTTELETGIEEPIQKEVAKEEPEVKSKVEIDKSRPIYRDKKDIPPRDTVGLPDDLAEHFKNDMSRQTYEKLKPIVLEKLALANQVKELSTKLKSYADNGVPESYYEHPNAFVLHPDYVSNLQTVDKAQTISNHWAAQNEAVKSGAATYQQIHVDQQGNLFTTEAKADASAEAVIMRAMIFSQNQLMQQQANLQTFSKIHQERHNQAIKWVDDLEHKDPIFQMFENAQNKDQLINNAASILKDFHPSFQNNPLARPLAKAKLMVATMAQMLMQAQQANGNTQTTNNQQTTNQPKTATARRSSNPTNANLGGHNTEPVEENGKVTVDMFNKVKEGY